MRVEVLLFIHKISQHIITRQSFSSEVLTGLIHYQFHKLPLRLRKLICFRFSQPFAPEEKGEEG